MKFDATCVRCGSILQHLGTDGGDVDGTLKHHYRCQNDGCKADGGTVVTCDGSVTQLHGPSVDVGHDNAHMRGELA